MKALPYAFFFAFGLLVSSAQAQNLKKEWAFIHQKDGQTRQLTQGQYITINWNLSGKTKTSRGKLADITTDSVAISHGYIKENIAKKDIGQITIRKYCIKRDVLRSALVGIGLILLFLTLCLMAFQSLLVSTKQDSSPPIKERSYWPWTIAGLGLIVLALTSLRSPKAHIHQPFFKDWDLQEITAPNNNTP